MRLIKSGPDIPDRLSQAVEEGKAVFFCGAGISSSAKLPGFRGLVDKTYQLLGTEPTTIEQTALNDNRFDTAVSLLERRIGRIPVRKKIKEALTLCRPLPRGATKLHKALLTLSKTRKGHLRLITTNFDRMFFVVDRKHKHNIGPFLPLPKDYCWNSLIYLHGLLREDLDEDSLDQLVISSGDFGRAYLTQRWASRFVTELFRNYIVCFVGYSIDDPVLRYMLDALAADKISGEKVYPVYAFAPYKSKEDEVNDEWEAKGVQPILFNNENNYALLQQTFVQWADLYQDGLIGKRSVITRDAPNIPSKIKGDAGVDRVIWALSDSTGVPAGDFAKLNPPAPIEWLDVLEEHGLLMKDCLTPMGLIGPYSSGHNIAKLDICTENLAIWIASHAKEPSLLKWVIGSKKFLHPRLCDLILNKVRTQDNFPRLLAILWHLIASINYSPYTTGSSDLLNVLGQIKGGEWNPIVRIQLLDLLLPAVRLNLPYDWSQDAPQSHQELTSEEKMSRYAEWEIVLNCGDSPHYHFEKLNVLPIWRTVLLDCLTSFTTHLQTALDLMAMLGRIDLLSHYYRPSISDNSKNESSEPWTLLLDLCRDAWIEASKSKPDIALAELERWKAIGYPLFRRLVLFAYASNDYAKIKRN